MIYLYRGGKKGRMHISRHTVTGDATWKALCKIPLGFNRSINAPFSLGKGVCKRCSRIANPPAHRAEEVR